MKSINILSLVQAFRSLEKESLANFLDYYDIKIKNEEADDLTSLVNILHKETDSNIFNHFYVSYRIPQIGKEFDLLRFNEESVINIELKNTCTEEKIQKQLKRNKYYLSFIGKKVYGFSFIVDTGQLYYFNDGDELEKVDFLHLIQTLEKQKICKVNNIDNLFNPSDYLVSPFNSTEKFVKDEYFLTHQQEEAKSKILNTIKNLAIPNFIAITGSAGTGKTLLVYDIARQIIKADKKVLIVHCGYLNDGQDKLKNDYNWEIIPIKFIDNKKLSIYNLIIIDEAQRIRRTQLNKIVEEIQLVNGNCIFSYDKIQTLSHEEKIRDIDHHIKNISSIVMYNLSEKIRTNKEIASFIKVIFNKSRNEKLSSKDNIELNYFESIDDAKEFLNSLDSQEWEVLRFTPSLYNNEYHGRYSTLSNKTSHKVIGQEFDNVVVTIDNFFSYDTNGELIYKNISYYEPVKMLFQNITRTRKRLNLVIINNSEILDRCISVLKA